MTTAAPCWTVEDAAAAARTRFGIEAAARLLTSERDQNFHLKSAGGAYVLKVANAAEDAAIIDLQNEALDHIAGADPGMPVPRVVRSIDGASWERIGGLIVRVLTWLPGAMMHEHPRTPVMRASLGALHARLATALASFEHAAAHRALMWDVSRAGDLAHLIAHVADPERRRLAERGLDRFARRAAPVLAKLPARIIHNDVNLHNVVVAGAPPLAAAIIDFGDMVRAPLACDVAVAAAYHVDAAAGADVLDGAVQYASAFHASLPLSKAELDILLDLIVARLTMTALITNWRAALYPENAAYILRNAPAAWAGLAALQDENQRLEIGA